MKLSIIIPGRNVANTIDKCLDSIIYQSFKDFEVIFIDDGSVDNTLEIVKEYQNKDERIMIIENKENKGIGYSRNMGIRKAKGEYLYFVDSDDWIEDGVLNRIVKRMDNGLDVLVLDLVEMPSGKPQKCFPFEDNYLKDNPVILLNIEYGINKAFRREMIIEKDIWFEENLKYEDMPFVAKAIYWGKVGHLKGENYYYLIHEGSQQKVVDARSFDIYKILDIVREYYGEYYYDEIEMLMITQVTRYMLKQKYSKDERKKEFIEKGFRYLDQYYPNWRKNIYYLKGNKLKRIIKNNETLVKWYCGVK